MDYAQLDHLQRQLASPLLLSAVLILFLLTAACNKTLPARAERSSSVKVEANIWGDADSDGIPDGAELHSFDDRANFRRWFTAIAENQFYEISEAWTKEQRDCAGLVRFAWREALRRHDRPWIKSVGGFTEPVASDVRTAYQIEHNPLGEKLFRCDYGSFEKRDLAEGKFSEFADARTIKNYNCVFVSRDRRLAQPGDLLFFHQPWVQRFPYHVMIFLGTAHEASEGANDWVVYHTGSSSNDEGTVKKVRLALLDQHPNWHWRPLVDNPNFLGFYRLKIVN